MGAVDLEGERGTSTGEMQPFVLAVGRLANEKGFDLLVEAFEPVALCHKDISLVIVGDGPDRELLMAKVLQLNLKDRVKMKGELPKDQIGAYYRDCLFVVAPSRWEGLGRVLLEGFSYGKAVIATRVGGIPEIVTDGVTGLMVKPENKSELTDAMRRLLTDGELRKRLGADAKSFVDTLGG